MGRKDIVPPGQPPPPHGPRVLYAPWRMSYMDMLSAAEQSDPPGPAKTPEAGVPGGCFLRQYWLAPADDDRNLVVVRTGREGAPGGGRGGLILLNRYPYANGHLLVALGEGRPRLGDYTPGQRAELWSLVDLASELCERTLRPQGVNIGVNQGLAAGAGVPEHLHAHVVPRWNGDVNFITVVGRVRVLPGALEDMFSRYRDVWSRILAEQGITDAPGR